jgi:hypothetical protein
METKTKLFSEIKLVRDKVKFLLKKNDRTRDNDDYLISLFWFHQLKELGKNPDELTTTDFLSLYSKGTITAAESIRRNRQLLQAEFVELRGKFYKDRKKDGITGREKLKTENGK